MTAAARILVIGDTLLNQTMRAEPALLGRRRVPAAFLNEELLHLRATPDWSIQGAGYVARYLAESEPRRAVSLLTETRNPIFPGLLRQLLTGLGDQAASIYAVEDRSAPVVTRVLRDVAASRSMGPLPDYRPQLRIDTPPQPLPPEHGRGPALEEAIEAAFAPLGAGDRCLLRTTSSEFLGGYGAQPGSPAKEVTEEMQARTERAIGRVLTLAQARGVRMIVDLRPLPRRLDLRDPETIISTTIGRLGDTFGHSGDHRATVEAAFWRLSPARALVCFAADEGVWVAVRGDRRSKGELFQIPVRWPSDQGDGCGMVVGGDAFVASLVDALDRGAAPAQAACEAAAALYHAQGQPLGAALRRSDAEASRGAIPAPVRVEIEDPAGEPVLTLAERLRDGSAEPMWSGLVAPAGGRMRGYFSELRAIFEEWRPRPGRDLVAIFGESRSGKEFPLKVALKGLGQSVLGPVNMHQFLAETGGVITELQRRSAEAGRPLVLVIDEVVPDDASRSLLNLTAEKVYRRYGSDEAPLSFVDNPVVLLSSIDPSRLLRDMQGRLLASVEVPPLRERQDEIPFLMPMVLGEALQEALGERVAEIKAVDVSVRLMAALLAHDYRPVEGAPSGFGLDQQNFRALADLVTYAVRRGLARDAPEGQLELRAADLPTQLGPLAPPSLDDGAAGSGFRYVPPFDRPGIPTPPAS